MNRLYLGCHLSIAKGFLSAVKTAVSIDANTFQFFTRNPRGGKAKAIDSKDISAMERIRVEHGFGPLFAHGSYTMNLASDKEDVRDFAHGILLDDMERLRELPPDTLYVFHPGSHVSGSPEEGMEEIIKGINAAVLKNPEANICLEGMSGSGSEIGYDLEQLRYIIGSVKQNERLGVCLDTCHMYSSGLDIVTDLDGVIKQIDSTIGINRVKMIHLNDSKTPLGSRKDRHEKLGEGTIGFDALMKFLSHPMLSGRPVNLETPNELDGYKEEIKRIRKFLE